MVCHGSADDLIQAECDQTFTYLSNGDDVFALTQVGTGAVLDVIGIVGDDPGSGFDVAGVSAATKDHTLVRKAEVTTGNALWLDNPETGESGSAGTDADNSEWVVFDQNTWDNIGTHQFDGSIENCLPGDINNDDTVNVVDIVSVVSFILGNAEPSDEEECAADTNSDGTINVVDIVSIVAIILGN